MAALKKPPNLKEEEMRWLTEKVAKEALEFLTQDNSDIRKLENILLGYKFLDYQSLLDHEKWLQISYGEINCPSDRIGIELVDDVDHLGSVYLSKQEMKSLLADFLDGA